jgi:hypothetical protein
MSQNGPFPGPPSQPWSGDGTDEPYTAPSDPWGDHTTASRPAPWSGAEAGYTADPLSGVPPSWASPPSARPRRNTPIVALVVVLGLLILGGIGTTAWLLIERNKKLDGSAADHLPTTQPTTAANVAEPQPSEDARFVKKGQCVRNEGTAAKPAMTIVACTTGTYEVLKRVDGRTTGESDAELKCAKVPNYTKWYYYDTELDSLDFVLCLKER